MKMVESKFKITLTEKDEHIRAIIDAWLEKADDEELEEQSAEKWTCPNCGTGYFGALPVYCYLCNTPRR